MSIDWKKLKGSSKRRRLRCMNCDTPYLMIITEPVKRQAKTLTAKHVRIVAKCPDCKTERVIKTGAPQ